MLTLLLIILLLVALGALPTWPYCRSWGYYPRGGPGLIVAVVVILDTALLSLFVTMARNCISPSGTQKQWSPFWVVGIASMRGRLRLGGELTISRAEPGTLVEAKIPRV